MDKQQLDDTLARLHQELSARPELDAESRERLSQLLADIQRVLTETPEESQTHAGEKHESLRDRLQDAIVDFEAAHPQFSQLMGRIADGLSQMGI
jgi:hypothetical protein